MSNLRIIRLGAVEFTVDNEHDHPYLGHSVPYVRWVTPEAILLYWTTNHCQANLGEHRTIQGYGVDIIMPQDKPPPVLYTLCHIHYQEDGVGREYRGIFCYSGKEDVNLTALLHNEVPLAGADRFRGFLVTQRQNISLAARYLR